MSSIFVRTKTSIETRSSNAPDESTSTILAATLRACTFSPNGLFAAFAYETHVDVVRLDESFSVVAKLPVEKTVLVGFSPKSRFVSTWRRRTDPVKKNLQIFHVDTGEVLFETDQKAQKLPQWTESENVFSLSVSNEVHLYTLHAVLQSENKHLKLRIQNLESYALSPTIKGKKEIKAGVSFLSLGSNSSQPARIGLYLNVDAKDKQTPARSSKSAFRVEEASFAWASTGRGCLVKTETTHDSTGKSYYGESSLYLVQAQEPFEGIQVETESGGIMDYKWNPTSEHFAAISGRMPCRVSLFHGRDATMLFDLGVSHRNTLSFSPNGRVLNVSGFGNLSGKMDFWNVDDKKLIGASEANCAVSFGWSNDSSEFLTATLTPRMNVDNGFTVFSYNGTKKSNTSIDKLTQCVFLGSDKDPLSFQFELKTSATMAENKLKNGGRYKPPGATGSLSQLLAKTQGLSSSGVKPAAKAYTPPGARGGIPGMKPKEVVVKQRKQTPQRVKKPLDQPISTNAYTETEKRLRKLKKLLKQIAMLEEKPASERTEAQAKKIEQKLEVEVEIKMLESK